MNKTVAYELLKNERIPFWGKQALWSFDQAKYLLHGIEPDSVDEDLWYEAEPWASRPWRETEVLLQDAIASHRIYKRGFDRIYIESLDVLEWAEKMDIDTVPSVLRELVRKYQGSDASTSWKAKYEEAEKRIQELEAELLTLRGMQQMGTEERDAELAQRVAVKRKGPPLISLKEAARLVLEECRTNPTLEHLVKSRKGRDGEAMTLERLLRICGSAKKAVPAP